MEDILSKLAVCIERGKADKNSPYPPDMKDQDGSVDVYIHYLGACKGCPSSQTGTQMFIEEILHRELDKHIRVVTV